LPFARLAKSALAQNPPEIAGLDVLYPSLDAFYIDLHKNPELSLHRGKPAAKLRQNCETSA